MTKSQTEKRNDLRNRPPNLTYLVTEQIKLSGSRPITAKELSSIFEVTEVRIRQTINDARSNGIPICAVRSGYFYSTDNENIRKTIDSLKHRIASIERAIYGLDYNL